MVSDMLGNLAYSFVGFLAGIGVTALFYRMRGYRLHRGDGG